MWLHAVCGAELSDASAVGEQLARDGLVMIREGGVREIREFLTGWTVAFSHPHDLDPGLTIVTPRPREAEDESLAGFGRSSLVPQWRLYESGTGWPGSIEDSALRASNRGPSHRGDVDQVRALSLLASVPAPWSPEPHGIT